LVSNEPDYYDHPDYHCRDKSRVGLIVSVEPPNPARTGGVFLLVDQVLFADETYEHATPNRNL
jgi:hypothetical protein